MSRTLSESLILEGIKALRETRGSPLVPSRGVAAGPSGFLQVRMPFGYKGGSARPKMDVNSMLGQVIPKTPSARVGKINDPDAPFRYQSGRMKSGQSNKGNTSKKNPDEDATMGPAVDQFVFPTLDKPSHMYDPKFIEDLNTGSPVAHHLIAPEVAAGDVVQAYKVYPPLMRTFGNNIRK